MHSFRGPLAPFITTALLLMGTGCASVSTERFDVPHTPMTVLEAREAMAAAIGKLRDFESVRNLKISRQSVSFICILPDSWWIDESMKTWEYSLTFSDIESFRVQPANSNALVFVNGHTLGLKFPASDAMTFVNAALVLKGALRTPEQEASDLAAFSTSAGAWLATTPKPQMSDEALTYRALAEDAISRKDFSRALDAYSEALRRHPMWPEGHYNAAMLADEAEDFELAAHHMRRYVVLAPDAPDATAARAKFLLWQHKAATAVRPVDSSGAIFRALKPAS